ncbi:oxaloacetate transport protein [Anaeramoeba flamelloides]|uniref:Oxaloacetate transport protein n=1 Tax=Anaeramoeba flamelloides TaxID=1746091 RepID=A0AAV8A9Z1_9EUKA|nr:oxaloacetate transport protein [Anaeramoeba flamelloides]
MSKKQAKQQELQDKPCKWFKNGYLHLLGGTVATTASALVQPLNGHLPTLSSLHETFVSEGVQNVVFENISDQVEKHMEEFNNPKDHWKIGVASGLVIGAVNSLIDSVFSNVFEYHHSEKENGSSCYSKSAVNLVKEKGFGSLFEGYGTRAFSKMLFVPTLRTALSLNGYWLNQKFAGTTCPIKKQVVLPMIKGAIAATEAILITKPIEETVRSIVTGQGIKPKEIAKKTWDKFRYAVPDIAIEVMLYPQGMKLMKPTEKALKGLCDKVRSKF